MSLEASVATVLRAYPVSRVNFKIGNILINNAQMEKVAKARGETVTDLVVAILNKQTASIELTAEDYERIAEEIRKYKERKHTGPVNSPWLHWPGIVRLPFCVKSKERRSSRGKRALHRRHTPSQLAPSR